MAKNSIRDFDGTAANNTDIQSTDISEGCPASGINNAIRELMADLSDVSDGTVALETPAADRLDVDNIRIDGNTISSTDTNGDITLDPDGTGDVIVASGNVGVGTSSPSTFSPDTTYANVQSIVKTDQAMTIGSYYQAGVDAYSFIKSSQVGSPTTAIDLRFFGGTSEHMRIDSSGNLLVADATNVGTADHKVSIQRGSAGRCLGLGTTVTTAAVMMSLVNGNGTVGTIQTNGSGTSYNESSDHRLKENVVALTGAIDRVKALTPKRFNFIVDPDTTVDGFIAHEAQAVVPEAVTGTHNEVDDDGNAVYQGIDKGKLVPLLTAALKESIAKIETLETQRADLEARLTALENA